MKIFNLHMISDSTGETLYSVARAVVAQFDEVRSREFLWPLVRTEEEIDKILEEIRKKPGVVMYTLINRGLRIRVKSFCKEMELPCIPILSQVINDISDYLKIKARPKIGSQHRLDENYFSRVEAVNFSIAHDDGQSTWDLDKSDIILLGVSRTSKSPTSIYLAYRGYKTANIPFVMNCDLPENLTKITRPIIIGLTIDPERLIQVRRNRLVAMNDEQNKDYIDAEKVREEIKQAKKLFIDNNWPIIDVTRKSVEETAVNIIQYYQKLRK